MADGSCAKFQTDEVKKAERNAKLWKSKLKMEMSNDPEHQQYHSTPHNILSNFYESEPTTFYSLLITFGVD